MKNILVIDIGNSYTKIGLFNSDDDLKKKILFKTKKHNSFFLLSKLLKENFDSFQIDSSIIGSVVPNVTNTYVKTIKKIFNINPYLLSNKTNVSFNMEHIKREEIGDDIIALTEYCSKKTKNAIAFSFGTAMFGIYLKDNILQGATIAPGIGTSYKQLINKSSLLNEINLNKKSTIHYGNNTIDALNSGVNNLRTGFVMSFYNNVVKNKNILCVISGGEAFKINVDFKYEINENAILLGFKYIYEKNN